NRKTPILYIKQFNYHCRACYGRASVSNKCLLWFLLLLCPGPYYASLRESFACSPAASCCCIREIRGPGYISVFPTWPSGMPLSSQVLLIAVSSIIFRISIVRAISAGCFACHCPGCISGPPSRIKGYRDGICFICCHWRCM